jgi:hypothetical protein
MKRCTVTHQVAGFGELAEGALIDEDDWPYAVDADCFDEADAPSPRPTPAKRAPRKFAQKPIAPGSDD